MTGFEPKRSRWWLALALLACACGKREPEEAPAHQVQPAPVEPTPAEPVRSAAEPAPAAAETPPAERPARSAEAKPAVAAPSDPSAPAREAEPRATAQPSATKPSKSATSKPASKSPATTAKPARAATVARAPEREPEPAPSVPTEPPPPEPAAAPAPAPVAKPPTRVVIPNTDRVRVEVPAGLQGWLDKDTRMQPWLGKVMKVIDACYADVLASNPSASGTISFRITMHQNARPDPDIQSLPGQLSGVVACATGQLMRTRMPLFTGTEGEQYVVRVRFGN